MKNENAVSEILGAVVLIGIVVLAFVVIGVMMTAQTPTSSSQKPVATTGSHCVKCSEQNYEMYLRHEGGEPYVQDKTSFEVTTANGKKFPITPFAVYNSIPQECAGSSTEIAYAWGSLDSLVPGQVVQFYYNPNYYDNSPPESITIIYDNTPLDTLTYETVKNKTEVLPTGYLIPVLKSVTSSNSQGECDAIFYYDNTLGVTIKASPCSGEAIIVDENDYPVENEDAVCPKPWNEFVGVGLANQDYGILKKDMGQPKEFKPNEELSQYGRSFVVKDFKGNIKWKLGNSNSVVAECSDCPGMCGPNEARVWGYLFSDENADGNKDANEGGLVGSSVTVVGRYKNNPNVPSFTDTHIPKQSGCWESRCIKMSGWAFNITAKIPDGTTETTQLSYPDYENKMTGQDKKNYPRIDFGASGVPAANPEPEPDPTVPIPSDTEPPTVNNVAVSQQNKNAPVVITWIANDVVGISNIVIRLSDDNGVTFPYIIHDGAGNPGTYSWNPSKDIAQAKFMVIAYDAAGNVGSKESTAFEVKTH